MVNKTESGSAIIYIFIGVALFGALMFMFARGSGQGSRTLTETQSKLAASEVSGYATSIEKAVQRLLHKGCSENQITFDSPQWNAYGGSFLYDEYQNNSGYSPADYSCYVFRKEGGGATWQIPSGDALSFPGDLYNYTGTQTVEGIGTAIPELSLVLQVKREVCIAINKLNNINMPDGLPINNDTAANAGYPTPIENWQAYGDWLQINNGSRFTNWRNIGNAEGLDNHKSGCYSAGPDSEYNIFYYVLIAR